MAPVIPGFTYQRVDVGGLSLNSAVAGSGPAVVLLHGFPQTHLMWRHVAPDLAADHTVIIPDLRGYGDSDKPVADAPDVYSKRTMADDAVALAKAFGFDRFAVVGHDRGAHVAFRAGLDHPDKVTHVAALDILPTADMWEALGGRAGFFGFHLYLMAQPPPLPEKMIAASADVFFDHFLSAWSNGEELFEPEIRAAYLEASRHAVDSIVADYRASAGIDNEHDLADRAAGRKLTMPVTVLQQDLAGALGFEPATVWHAWATDLDHRTVPYSHFMAEEAPEAVTRAIRDLLKR